jgi:hypothetical protein
VSITLPTPDWTDIVGTIVPLFFKDIAAYFLGLFQQVLDALAGSGANILTRTAPEWTYDLGPLRDMSRAELDARPGILALALVLAGFGLILRRITGWSITLAGTGARIALALIFATGFWTMAKWAIDLVNAINSAIGASQVPLPNVGVEDPLVVAVVTAFWVFAVARLLFRMAYRLLMVDVLLLFGPIVMLLWAVPQTQWIARRWLTLAVSWLFGQCLVVACLKLAAVLANPVGGAWAGTILGIGVLFLAYDAVSIIGDRSAQPGGALAPFQLMAALPAAFGTFGASMLATGAAVTVVSARQTDTGGPGVTP